MTLEEYYKILEKRWKQVNKDNLQEIKQYNEFKRMLRKEIENGKNTDSNNFIGRV